MPQSKIVPDIALIACQQIGTSSSESRRIYEDGRAAVADSQPTRARNDFEKALAMHYRVAAIDLAALLTEPTAGMLDLSRAMTLYEGAWKDGVVIGAFRLGELYEHGVLLESVDTPLLTVDEDQAWVWYAKAAARGEPNALARFALRAEEKAALVGVDRAHQSAWRLEALTYYAAAAEQARRADWPDDSWSLWRYRRATARVLARDGMMKDVAASFASLRDEAY